MKTRPAAARPCRMRCGRHRSRRGGVLITALIFSSIIGMLVLPSYLMLSRQALRTSHRAFYNVAVVDLAETGLEHALWSLNAASGSAADAWTDWTLAGGNASTVIDGFTYSGGVTGKVKVYVAGYGGPGASVVSRAVITLATGEKLEKWMRVTTKGRSLFEFGLLARDKISAEGGCVFDSWKSDHDDNPLTPPIPYSAAVSRGNGSIAAASTAAPAVTLKPSAKVYGRVSVGTNSGAPITYGHLGWPNTPGANTAAGLQQDWGTTVGPRGSPETFIQNGYLSTGFTASFPAVTAPDGVTEYRNTYVLSYNDPKKNNAYINQETLGSAGTKTVIQLNKLTVKGDGKLTIAGDVTLILPPSGQTTFEIIQGASLTLAAGASLKIYTPGNIAITGGASAGVINNSTAEALQIWSTRPSGSMGQTISLEGSGKLNGVIYAPDATFTAPGGTTFSGSAIVYSAVLKGSGSVYYDESLKKFTAGGGGGSVQIDSYAELDTPAERTPYAEAMAL